MKKLPIGTQSFTKIRKKKSYYVDKTVYLDRLLSDGSDAFFLSRPRRFGKSLLLDTIQCLFQGKKELFEGLYIYDKWDWSKTYPVLRLCIDGGVDCTPESTNKDVVRQLNKFMLDHGIPKEETEDQYGPGQLSHILTYIRDISGKMLVVLIDEYDHPILNATQDKKNTDNNIKYLRSLFGKLKKHPDDVMFLFITGISMFSKKNLLSDINHLKDISMRSDYANICGYTELDLTEVFADEIKNFDIEKVKRWYDGYCWHRKGEGERLFCPHSILNLFAEGVFEHWWYVECFPRHFYEVLKQHHLTALDLSDKWVFYEQLSGFDLESMKLTSLMFQYGFLTIREVCESQGRIKYLLSYPNIEVQESLTRTYLVGVLQPETLKNASDVAKAIVGFLNLNDIEGLRTEIFAVLATTPYYWYVSMGWHQDLNIDESQYSDQQIEEMKRKAKPSFHVYEAWYANTLFTMFSCYLNSNMIRLEEASRFGRSDMVITHGNKVFVFELKCGETAAEHKKLLDVAINQIKDRGYARKYRRGKTKCYGVALAFGRKEGNVVGAHIEELF